MAEEIRPACSKCGGDTEWKEIQAKTGKWFEGDCCKNRDCKKIDNFKWLDRLPEKKSIQVHSQSQDPLRYDNMFKSFAKDIVVALIGMGEISTKRGDVEVSPAQLKQEIKDVLVEMYRYIRDMK